MRDRFDLRGQRKIGLSRISKKSNPPLQMSKLEIFWMSLVIVQFTNV